MSTDYHSYTYYHQFVYYHLEVFLMLLRKAIDEFVLYLHFEKTIHLTLLMVILMIREISRTS
jgi:hypothetical protein